MHVQLFSFCHFCLPHRLLYSSNRRRHQWWFARHLAAKTMFVCCAGTANGCPMLTIANNSSSSSSGKETNISKGRKVNYYATISALCVFIYFLCLNFYCPIHYVMVGRQSVVVTAAAYGVCGGAVVCNDHDNHNESESFPFFRLQLLRYRSPPRHRTTPHRHAAPHLPSPC